ncbi:MAG: RNA polymerase sigma factor FliA [Syntrophobacteraceae bacterium]
MLQTNLSLKNRYFAQRSERGICPEDKEQIILQHCALVKYMAIRLVSRLPNSVQMDDLFNAGIIGLIDAVDKFDPLQGIQFETYAKIRVRGAMLDEIRSMDWVPRSLRQKSSEMEKACTSLCQKLGRDPSDEEIAEELGVSIDEYFQILDEIKGISVLPEDIHDTLQESRGSRMLTTESDNPVNQIHKEEIASHLTAAISTLPEKEQMVLALYYYEELTMKEIGAVLGYTESRISQIHTKAVLKLRNRLARKLKKEDLPESCHNADLGNQIRQPASKVICRNASANK